MRGSTIVDECERGSSVDAEITHLGESTVDMTQEGCNNQLDALTSIVGSAMGYQCLPLE